MEIDSGFGFQQDRRGTGLDANLARLKKAHPHAIEYEFRRCWILALFFQIPN
jgi:hypothetical protein